MTERHELKETTYRQSLAKGLLAGLVGGLVATAAKSVAEKIYPPRTHGEPEPPEVLAERRTAIAPACLAAGCPAKGSRRSSGAARWSRRRRASSNIRNDLPTPDA